MSPRSLLPTVRGFPSLCEIKACAYPQKVGEKLPRLTLALDLSTTCIGWAVGTSKEQLVRYGKVVITDDRAIGEKLKGARDFLRDLLRLYRPSRVLCEQPMARRGQVTALHNQLIGMVRLLVFETLEYEILDSHLISPRTVKNLLGVPRGESHDHNKQIMVDHVNNVLGLGLRYHKGSKLQSDDDIADSIAILLADWAKRRATE